MLLAFKASEGTEERILGTLWFGKVLTNLEAYNCRSLNRLGVLLLSPGWDASSSQDTQY